MRVEVAEFADRVSGEAGQEEGARRMGRGGWRGGSVEPGGHVQAREQPVVRAVLDDVARRHGGGGEAVHEERFEFAFEEVQHDEGEGEGLQAGRVGRGGGVDVWAQGVDERVD